MCYHVILQLFVSSISMHLLHANIGCQERSHLCARTPVVVDRLRRQTYVKFTSALTQANGRTHVTCLAAARPLPVQLTTRTTSAFTPVPNTFIFHSFVMHTRHLS